MHKNDGASSATHAVSRWANFQTTYAKQVADHFPLFCGVIGLLAVVGAVAAVGGGLGALGKGPISQVCRTLPPSFRLPGCRVLTAGGVTGLTVALLGIVPIAYGKGMQEFIRCAEQNGKESSFSLTDKITGKMLFGIAHSSWAQPTSGFWRHHVGARLGYGGTSILLTIASLWDFLVGAAAGVVTLATAGKHPGARYVTTTCLNDAKTGLLERTAVSLLSVLKPFSFAKHLAEQKDN